MDLRSQMNYIRQAEGKLRANQATAEELYRYMPTKDGSTRSRMVSKTYVLAEIPLASVAVVDAVVNIAAARDVSEAPIVVDVNKKNLGKSPGGYVPKVIVVEGSSRHNYARKHGRQTVMAWVGASAQRLLDLQCNCDGLQASIQKSLGFAARLKEVYPFEKSFIFSQDGEDFKQRYSTDSGRLTLEGSAQKMSKGLVPMSAGGPGSGRKPGDGKRYTDDDYGPSKKSSKYTDDDYGRLRNTQKYTDDIYKGKVAAGAHSDDCRCASCNDSMSALAPMAVPGPAANRPGTGANVISPSPSVQSPGSGAGPRVAARMPNAITSLRSAQGRVKKIVTKKHKALLAKSAKA